MTTIFLTGASGFLGSRVYDRLCRGENPASIILDRSGRLGKNTQRTSSTVEIVHADLLDVDTYRESLKKADIVLHLAALTGKASQQQHFRVNAEGTAALVKECVAAGVKRILFVSSIATKFPDKRKYYYAQAKVRAEETVRSSGLRFTIVRPTIILGQGSGILSALEKLAGLPVIPVFGNGRAKVQPIYVDDLVDFLFDIIKQDRFSGETLELGGPVTLTIEELLQNIRLVRKGSVGRAVHIPMQLLLPPLGAAESIGLGPYLPVSVGQLASFRYDGIIQSNSLYESHRAVLRNVRQMLELSVAA
jgi:nucleoside-diphosphate-sugar epimerase